MVTEDVLRDILDDDHFHAVDDPDLTPTDPPPPEIGLTVVGDSACSVIETTRWPTNSRPMSKPIDTLPSPSGLCKWRPTPAKSGHFL